MCLGRLTIRQYRGRCSRAATSKLQMPRELVSYTMLCNVNFHLLIHETSWQNIIELFAINFLAMNTIFFKKINLVHRVFFLLSVMHVANAKA